MYILLFYTKKNVIRIWLLFTPGCIQLNLIKQFKYMFYGSTDENLNIESILYIVKFSLWDEEFFSPW